MVRTIVRIMINTILTNTLLTCGIFRLASLAGTRSASSEPWGPR